MVADAANASMSLSAVHVRRIGKTLLVTGHASGVARIAIRALSGGRTVGSVTAKVRSGRFRATLRAPLPVRVVISAGAAKRTIRVR